jgi:hypothetical protein
MAPAQRLHNWARLAVGKIEAVIAIERVGLRNAGVAGQMPLGFIFGHFFRVGWGQFDPTIAEIEGADTARLWVTGNDGSAAIADHLYAFGSRGRSPLRNPQSRSFASIRTALLTSFANDVGWEAGFSRQLEMYAQATF